VPTLELTPRPVCVLLAVQAQANACGIIQGACHSLLLAPTGSLQLASHLLQLTIQQASVCWTSAVHLLLHRGASGWLTQACARLASLVLATRQVRVGRVCAGTGCNGSHFLTAAAAVFTAPHSTAEE
jgi:hypothetical protein